MNSVVCIFIIKRGKNAHTKEKDNSVLFASVYPGLQFWVHFPTCLHLWAIITSGCSVSSDSFPFHPLLPANCKNCNRQKLEPAGRGERGNSAIWVRRTEINRMLWLTILIERSSAIMLKGRLKNGFLIKIKIYFSYMLNFQTLLRNQFCYRVINVVGQALPLNWNLSVQMQLSPNAPPSCICQPFITDDLPKHVSRTQITTFIWCYTLVS